MRRGQTDAEAKLWKHLRAGRFKGLKFRRQHPAPPYIADFCCVEKRLVIELDGSQHTPEGDAVRTRNLQLQGWHVVRFWDDDVLRRTEEVLEAIWNLVSDTDPLPNPSPGGRGA
jgi:very-short-patch-repair endonuclease